MRAVRFGQYGPVGVLAIEEVPEPAPGPGEVLVGIVATSINPGEAKIRSGALHDRFPATFPSGQGSDFAGRVRAVGDGVTAWHIDDEVIGWTDNRAAHADLVVVDQDNLTIRPPDVAWEQGASLFVAGSTAYAAVRAADPKEGETVAVSAAAGGVGSFAVQLLVARGVRVLGIAGSGNAEWLRSVGAEPVAHGDGLGHRLREAAPDGIDAFLDLFGPPYVELAVGLGVAPGRVVTIIDYPGAEKFGARVTGGAEVASAAVLAELADMIAAGDVTVPIAATYPLDQIQQAFTELADGHTRGKIVLTVGAR